MRLLRMLSTGALLAATAASLATAQDEPGVRLRLQLAKGDEVAHDLRFTLRGNVVVSSGLAPSEQPLDVAFEARMTVTCTEVLDDAYDVSLLASDVKVTNVMEAGGDRLTVTLSEDAVRIVDSRGEPVVDSDEGLHADVGRGMLAGGAELATEESGRIDRRGQVIESSGGSRDMGGFVGSAFYAVDLPEQAVRVGDTWTGERRTRALGELTLAEPLTMPVEYELLALEDEGRVARVGFRVKAEIRDRAVRLEQAGAGALDMNLDEFEMNAEGSARLAVANGMLLDVRATGTNRFRMSMDGGFGASVSVSVDAESDVVMTRVER